MIECETAIAYQTAQVLTETALILRGEHLGWDGDQIANAESHLRRLARESDQAADVANHIESDIKQASEISGLHPHRCRWMTSVIRNDIKTIKELGLE